MRSILLQIQAFPQFLNTVVLWAGIDWGNIDPTYRPVLIFFLRTCDLSLATLRMLAVVRGRRLSAWTLAILQSSLYIVSLTGVLSDIRNPLTVLAYAGGFATGTIVGMWAENRRAPGHILLRITSSNLGPAIRDVIHHQGFGATELVGTGKDGTVSMLMCFVTRKQAAALEGIVLGVDHEAFLTAIHVRRLHGGWRL
ncbi:MAG: DUF5698 domain-containing protein [Anaerolineales bacterium]|nr:DUF5698 domain-containing protein [Anaerolineales bacterium]